MMSDFALSYAKQVYKHFRLYANYSPFNKISLGDIGVLDQDFIFNRKDSINSLFNITFKQRTSRAVGAVGSISNHMNFSTAKNTTVQLLAKGESDLLNAGINISFKHSNSFFFNLAGIEVEEIEDQISLSKRILELFANDQWDDNWVVVTSCIKADSSIIIGSIDAESSVKLEAKTDVESIDLANTELRLGVHNAVSLGLQVVAEKGLVPLLKVSKIRRKIFSGPGFGFTENTESMQQLKQKVKENDGAFDDFFELAEIE